jgi:D-alanyl-D-alanine carboxypeptidase
MLVAGLCVLVAGLSVAPSPAAASSSRYASIVIDADTGAILHAANPDKRSYPASLTKVMTLYLVFDALEQGKLRLDSPLPVSAHAAAQSPSKLALEPGERIRVEDAIEALVTKSANDVAVVLAEGVGGSEAGFAQMMTKKARALGMLQTTYRNASGLPDLGQVSTVRDQAALGRAMVRNHAKYYHYFNTRAFTWRGQVIPTHNRLMLRYSGADGMKTGYIHASGFNLISSAKRDGKRVVGVVFGGDSAAWRDTHMVTLLDKGFARLKGGGVTRMAKVDEMPLPDMDEVKAVAVAARGGAKAAVPPKKPRDEAVGDADPGPWMIQVGAFSDYKVAHKAATDAAKKLGGLVAKASIDVDRAKQGKQTLFRARVSGFTEEQARAACHRLERAKKVCKIVQPNA